MSSYDNLHKYFILGVTHFDHILVGDRVGVVHEAVDSVGDGAHTDGDAQSQNVDSGRANQVVWHLHEFVSSISHQVCLETQTERYIQGNVSTSSQTCQLHESDPFQNSCVLVNHFTLFEVQLGAWLSVGLLHEWLVQIHWVENVVLESEQPVDWSAQKLWMTQSVSNVLVLFFRFQLDVVFVTFGVEVFGDWSVGTFLFPLFDVLEVVFFVERGVGDEPVFVGENDFLVVDVVSFKPEVLQFGFEGSVLVDVFINTSDSVFVGPVKIADSLPDFSLDFEIVVEVIDDFVILFDFDFIVVLVKFGVDVLRGVGILVREPGVFFIFDFSIGFESVEVFHFFLGSQKGKTLVCVATEPKHGSIDIVLKHFSFPNL